MNRRGFLSSILVAAAAPAIVRADSLMRVVPRETTILQLHDELVFESEAAMAPYTFSWYERPTSPGAVWTRKWVALWASSDDDALTIASRTPLGAFGTVADVQLERGPQFIFTK